MVRSAFAEECTVEHVLELRRQARSDKGGERACHSIVDVEQNHLGSSALMQRTV